MSAHTPGQWRFYTEPQPNGCPIVGARGLMVCMLAHSVNEPEQRDEALANARLIAAAPDLLNALEDLYSICHGNVIATQMDQARAAIAAAKGEK